MFSEPDMAARFLELPIQKPGRQLADALRCATSYYSRSESKEAVILCLRLNHLYGLRMQVRRQKATEADKDVMTDELAFTFLDSSTHSLHLIAHLWKQLRSPKYGLNQKLIDAMKVTEIGQASSERAQESGSYFSLCLDDATNKLSFHALFCHYFEKAMIELDALLLDADACTLAERNHQRILEEWVAEHPNQASIYKVDKRKRHNADYYTDELINPWLVHCQDDIEKLATATSNTQFWTPKKSEKFALISTGDEALDAITGKANRRTKAKVKSKGKRVHEEGADNPLQQPVAKRTCPE
jgi:hypothetical protein